MLQAFVFERLGIVVGDLYFLDPDPHPGQEGAEHGVRLELRVFDRGDLKGTISSAMPIEVGRPIWRVDLLEAVDGVHHGMQGRVQEGRVTRRRAAPTLVAVPARCVRCRND